MKDKLTLKELELLNTASAYNGEQHKAICGKAALELIEYKKIEEELGIDLITLFKALKNGIYVRLLDFTKPTFKKTYVYWTNVNIIKNYFDIRRDRLYGGFDLTGGHLYYFKDYGNTWALTERELK